MFGGFEWQPTRSHASIGQSAQPRSALEIDGAFGRRRRREEQVQGEEGRRQKGGGIK